MTKPRPRQPPNPIREQKAPHEPAASRRPSPKLNRIRLWTSRLRVGRAARHLGQQAPAHVAPPKLHRHRRNRQCRTSPTCPRPKCVRSQASTRAKNGSPRRSNIDNTGKKRVPGCGKIFDSPLALMLPCLLVQIAANRCPDRCRRVCANEISAPIK